MIRVRPQTGHWRPTGDKPSYRERAVNAVRAAVQFQREAAYGLR